VLSQFRRIHNGILKFERGLLAFALIAMLLLAVAQIVLRNIFGSGIVWADSMVRLLVLWTALLGAMQATHFREHIRIDALLRLIPEKWNPRVRAIMDILAGIICALAAWFSGQFVYLEYLDGAEAFGHLPSWLTASIIPFAFSIMAIRFMVGSFLHTIVDNTGKE